jgi:uncharacterized membrane protein
MRSLSLSFFAALLALAVLDGLWLGIVSRDFYKARLGAWLRAEPVWTAALAFYVIHAAGIAVFAVPAAIGAGTWTAAPGFGALYGICVYAAYDLTNLATLRGWPATLSIVDLGWGAVATAIATVAAFVAAQQ